MKFIPRPYQRDGIAFLLERAHAGLFMKPGRGKTACVLAAIKLMLRRKLMRGALVLAPLRPTYLVWPREIAKWDEFQGLDFGILHGPDKDRVLDTPHEIYIMNYDGLPWLAERLRKRASWPFDVLVMDESTRLKHIHTERFRTLKPMLPRFKRRYILTGTPAPNGLLDLFGQAFAMDRGASLGPYITRFRLDYFYQTGFGGYTWLPKPDAEEQIFARLAPRVMQIGAEEDLRMPPLTINDVFVDLPPKARRVYDQLEAVFRLDFQEGRVTAANAAGASMKCRQVANGGIYLDGTDREWKQVHDAKADAVAELVEELSGDPALVAYDFLHDLERLRKVLGKDTPYIGGGVTPKRAGEIEQAWNKGELPVLLGQPQSIAHGLNLQSSGRTVIWAGLTWNLEDYEQLIDRVWRQGQKRPVIVHRIIARGTVDEAMVASLKAKDRGQNRLMVALSAYWKK